MTTSQITASRETQASILGESGSSAIAVYTVIVNAFGNVMFPEDGSDPIDPTLLWELAKEHFRVTIPEENRNKVQALWLASTTPAFYDDPLACAGMCTSIASGSLGDVIEGYMQPPDIDEMLMAIREVGMVVEGTELEGRPFSPAVRAMMAAVAGDDVLDVEDDFFEKHREQIMTELTLLGVAPGVIERALNASVLPGDDRTEPAMRY